VPVSPDIEIPNFKNKYMVTRFIWFKKISCLTIEPSRSSISNYLSLLSQLKPGKNYCNLAYCVLHSNEGISPYFLIKRIIHSLHSVLVSLDTSTQSPFLHFLVYHICVIFHKFGSSLYLLLSVLSYHKQFLSLFVDILEI